MVEHECPWSKCGTVPVHLLSVKCWVLIFFEEKPVVNALYGDKELELCGLYKGEKQLK